MGAKWQRIRIKIPKAYGPAERVAIADEVLRDIRKRTAGGRDKDGRKFRRYTDGYVNSPDFRAAGKSKNPNLELSGDMMAAMDLLSHKPGELLVGWENGSEENARADGNIRGTYGQATPSKKKARDPLGIPDKNLNTILGKFPLKNDAKRLERVRTILKSTEIADDIANRARASAGVDGDDDG